MVKLRNASPEALSLLAALAQATPEGRPVPPANTDHGPGSTRRRLEGLLDPRRMGGTKPKS